jgi:hypothetical protein
MKEVDLIMHVCNYLLLYYRSAFKVILKLLGSVRDKRSEELLGWRDDPGSLLSEECPLLGQSNEEVPT